MDFSTLLSWLNTPLVTIGQTPLTFSGIGVAILVFFSSLIVSSLVQKIVFERIVKGTKLDEGFAFAVQRIVHYVIVVVGVYLATQIIGIDLGSFAVLFGFLGVGIGLGLQNVTSNFVAGLLLLFERPISVGDFVEIDGQVGRVLSINMRATFIQTLDRVTVIVPNAKFTDGHVVNWSIIDKKMRVHCQVGVAYGSDLAKVKSVLLNVAANHSEVLKSPEPDVFFEEFGDSSLNFDLTVWINDASRQRVVRSQINFAIDAAFRQAGITIPFPQRDLHLQMSPAVN